MYWSEIYICISWCSKSCGVQVKKCLAPPLCASPLALLSAGGGGTSYQIFKKGGLTGPKLWEGVAGKEGGNFFHGGLPFLQKSKLKPEIFNNKKSL